MKEACYEYKCRRCGGTDNSTHSGEALAHTVMIKLITNDRVICEHGIPIGRLSIHHCKDGGMGMADFVGVSFKQE